ncbi:MAG TPA: hypothetical protein VN721_06675 [Flavipsychrobacter sp.]|nr:hypothetical protein [Flavipsychrobacter sp.]
MKGSSGQLHLFKIFQATLVKKAMDNNSLINTKIKWKCVHSNDIFFYAIHENEQLLLRVNYLPEGSLLTLINVNNLEITDIGERPSQWLFED